MTDRPSAYLAVPQWTESWLGDVSHWLRADGVHAAVLVFVATVGARVIGVVARRFANRIGHDGDDPDSLVLSESTKHRRAVASVISSVAVGVLYVVVAVDFLGTLGVAVNSLIAPAAVLGAALGLGAQRVVQDLLGGFFIIAEKQYGFGDLVVLTVAGGTEARGTVEDVTLRVTTLRNTDGEVFSVPNGQIVKTRNLSKDWARAVVDIPLAVGTDLTRVNGVLRDVACAAMRHDGLPHLLLDEPALMGVESIGRDTVCIRMVARTLPGKQFEAGRDLRALVVGALRRNGIITTRDATTAAV
jgi:small conductance mechanosensitive channel